MSVWLCLPSKRPAADVALRMAKWRGMGYRIALWRDAPLPAEDLQTLDWDIMLYGEKYPGYALAQNALVQSVFAAAQDCDWVVCAADDIDPDPSKSADEIALECTAHFLSEAWPKCWSWPAGKTLEEAKADGTAQQKPQSLWGQAPAKRAETFGVMQPTGDRWGDRQGAYIDRVAGSPWIGREFARRAYRGYGPYWPDYTHMGVDEELQAVAIKLGVFWQRPDLTQFHDHWGRARQGETMGQRDRMPAFLEHANSQEQWDRYKRIFTRRQAAGFPGSEVIP